jgi:hypothetical protein
LLYHWLADAVLAVHAAFVAFVVLGGLLVLWRSKLVWLHGPAVAWGVLTEYAGLTCPLTPLEIAFRHRGNEVGYEGGFIEHYVTAMIYPAGLTRAHQVGLATLVLVVNLVIYWQVLERHRRRVRHLSEHHDDTA